LHDEERAFAKETGQLREEALRNDHRLDWMAGGQRQQGRGDRRRDVVFIVIASRRRTIGLWTR